MVSCYPADTSILPAVAALEVPGPCFLSRRRPRLAEASPAVLTRSGRLPPPRPANPILSSSTPKTSPELSHPQPTPRCPELHCDHYPSSSSRHFIRPPGARTLSVSILPDYRCFDWQVGTPPLRPTGSLTSGRGPAGLRQLRPRHWGGREGLPGKVLRVSPGVLGGAPQGRAPPGALLSPPPCPSRMRGEGEVLRSL